MKILLGDFNTTEGRENIFRPTVGNDILHQDRNNGVRIVNSATSKCVVVRTMVFPHRIIHKYIWTSPKGKAHNQIDHILIARSWHSNILDVRSFKGADCDAYHYLLVSTVREGLTENKQAAEKFDGEAK
jgi:hypothetical protein